MHRPEHFAVGAFSEGGERLVGIVAGTVHSQESNIPPVVLRQLSCADLALARRVVYVQSIGVTASFRKMGIGS
jgi:hypothetical protein